MMRIVLSVLCLSFVSAVAPHVVSNYDVASYAGKWYQIADYPQFYEFACKQCVTATYTLNSDKTIKVDNTCRRSPTSGNTTVHAKASIKDSSQPGKLTVLFGGFFPASYWIVALGAKNTDGLYSWALVSNSDGSSCYILSRTPVIEDKVQTMVFEAMAKNKLDNSTLRFTNQKGCWDEEEEAMLKQPTVGGAASLHASCKMTITFSDKSCNDVNIGLAIAAKSMHGLTGCGKTNPPVDNLCGYTQTGSAANSWKGTHTTANGKYTDDLTFTLSASGAGCSAAAYSTSETWYAVLDNGVNYCNLHNLVAATNFTNKESDVSDSTCTQYSKADCKRY